MKKITIILLCFLFTSHILEVKAHEKVYFINSNNVEMTEEQYNYLLNFYNKNSIMNMTNEKFQNEMSMKFTKKNISEKYIKTVTYVDSKGVATSNDYEISKEEYDNPISTYANNCYVDYAIECWETTYKKLFIIDWVTGEGIGATERILLTNDWKVMPVTRSYDVIGIRYDNITLTNAWGEQYALTLDDGFISTEYSYNGTNMNIQPNGVGISQNLYNSTPIYSLSNRLIVEGIVTSNHVARYGSYQHATKEVTLAQSKNYSFGNGLGQVFLFNSGIGSYYDNMQGVSYVY